jgi:hypothetical protein
VADKIASVEDMNNWLDKARKEAMDPDSPFLEHIVHLDYNGMTVKRFPHEAAVFKGADGTSHRISMRSKSHVVWTSILFGRGEPLMRHLTNALLLGHALRYYVKPFLACEYNIVMENVLFLTSTSLTEDALRAVSFLWAIKPVDMPPVHPSRLAGVSQHLRDVQVDEAHIFLKCNAFRMTHTEFVIISDLDIVVTNFKTFAKNIARLLGRDGGWGSYFEPGSVGVMQRVDSQVSFTEKPVRVQSRLAARSGRPVDFPKVSYCYAIIRPSTELADRYEQLMAGEFNEAGLLSDQDLLGQVLAGRFARMSHQFVAFPSWWVQGDIYWERATKKKLARKHSISGPPWRIHPAGLAARAHSAVS